MTKLSIDQAYEKAEKALFELRRVVYTEGYADGKIGAKLSVELHVNERIDPDKIARELVEKINDSKSRKPQKSPQQQRDEIVERAKKDVEELMSRNYESKEVWFIEKDGYVISHECNFIINKDKRTIVALVGVIGCGVKRKGIAKCAPSDCFNSHIGKAIALRRALGLDVPSDYYNAPQPTEVRVGDVVGYVYDGEIDRFIITRLDGNMVIFDDGGFEFVDFFENGGDDFTTISIIDDSRDEVSE